MALLENIPIEFTTSIAGHGKNLFDSEGAGV